MSVLTVVLLSITPVLGIAVLLGMGRLERVLLDDHQTDERSETILEVGPTVITAPGPVEPFTHLNHPAA